jgi:hypothetical protein
MTVNDYPEFKPGQTLTSDELNLLAIHAWNRDRLVGRMIGFGINGGLSGSFSGGTLTIQPGLAVDQRGEPLVLPSSRTLSFTPSMSALPSATYSFLGAESGTYSVVLRATDTVTAAPACSEADCAGHSDKHTSNVTLDVVNGRLTTDWSRFLDNDIFTAEPLWLSATGQVMGSVTDFRNKLNTALNSLNPPLDPALVAKVSAVTFPSSDLMGVKGYKIGWLNTVLFATIDLMRCRALQAIQVFRDDSTPGVVLGAVTYSSGTWSFDCGSKHFWEPPKGLSQALLGSSCMSVCGASQDYLESVLGDYAPPDPPPPPATPPTDDGHNTHPDLDFCKLHRTACGYVLVAGPFKETVHIKLPKNPGDPSPVELGSSTRDRIYDAMHSVLDKPESNPFGEGVLITNKLIGERAVDVKATLEANIVKHGGAPSVEIVPVAQFANIDNLEHGNAVGLSDQIKVGVDDKGVAVGVAMVPVVVAARRATINAEKADAAGTQAAAALKATADLNSSMTSTFTTFEGSLKTLQGNFGALQADIGSLKGSPADAAVMDHRLTVLEQQFTKADGYEKRISTLEGKALAQVGDLGAKTYTVDVGNTLAEFAQTATKALQTIDQPRNANLTKYIAEVEIKQGQLELAVRAGDPTMVAGATVELLDSMRTMIGGAGVEAGAKRQLDAQFRAMKGLLG